MTFTEIFSASHKILSFEFFPPKNAAGMAQTQEQMRNLSCLKPDFMTVTYGAGGGTRAFTRDLVSFVHNELELPAAAHLTCASHSVAEIDSVLDDLYKEGIRNVVALRGDPPKGAVIFLKHPEGFGNARDLSAHISRCRRFSIAVAGYPETHQDAISPEADLAFLKEKVDAGAEVVITQLFFDPELYFRFRDRAAKIGIHKPIVPGIMPIGNVSQVRRFTTMCGASIPGALLDELPRFEDDAEGLTKFGIDYAIKQCQTLLDGGAPGIHLYTLNKSTQVQPLVEALSFGIA